MMLEAGKRHSLKNFSEDKHIIDIIDGLTYVLFFEADWSGASYLVKPMLVDLMLEYDKVIFIRINADLKKEFVKHFKVDSLPTILFIKNKQELGRIIGAVTKVEIEEKIKLMLNL